MVEDLIQRHKLLVQELEQLEASLGAVKARMVQASLSSNPPIGVQQEIDELRERTRSLAEGFGEMEKASDDVETGMSSVELNG